MSCRLVPSLYVLCSFCVAARRHSKPALKSVCETCVANQNEYKPVGYQNNRDFNIRDATAVKRGQPKLDFHIGGMLRMVRPLSRWRHVATRT